MDIKSWIYFLPHSFHFVAFVAKVRKEPNNLAAFVRVKLPLEKICEDPKSLQYWWYRIQSDR